MNAGGAATSAAAATTTTNAGGSTRPVNTGSPYDAPYANTEGPYSGYSGSSDGYRLGYDARFDGDEHSTVNVNGDDAGSNGHAHPQQRSQRAAGSGGGGGGGGGFAADVVSLEEGDEIAGAAAAAAAAEGGALEKLAAAANEQGRRADSTRRPLPAMPKAATASSLEELVSWNELFQQAAASVRRLESSNNTTLGFNTLLTPVVSARSDAESAEFVDAKAGDEDSIGGTASAAKDEPDQGEVTPGGDVVGRNVSPAAAAASAPHGKPISTNADDGSDDSVPHLSAQGASPFPTLAALARDFVYTASNYGRILIEEMNLPHHLKTLKPKEADGIGGAGGAKYVANGIYYKFCIDEKGDLFNGSTTAAQKVGLCELRGVRFFFSFSQICFPLVCVIDHLGHRVVAETVLPISMDTLRVGCPDAARGRRRSQSFVSSDDDLLRAMNAAGRRLNLAGHYVKAAKVARDGSSDIYVHTPYDMEGHRGRDGRMYCIDFSRAFPPQPPSVTLGGGRRKNSHLYRQFRPEFVMAYHEPLCSDAFSQFLGQRADRRGIEQAILTAWDALVTQNIPAFALALKKADDVRLRKLQAEQSKKLQSAARKGGRGFVRGSGGVSLASVGGASANDIAGDDSRQGLGRFRSMLQRICAAVTHAAPFMLRAASKATPNLEFQDRKSSSLLQAVVVLPVLAVAVVVPGIVVHEGAAVVADSDNGSGSSSSSSSNSNNNGNNNSDDGGLVSRLRAASFAWLRSPMGVLFGTTAAAGAVLWFTEATGASPKAGDRANYGDRFGRGSPDAQAKEGPNERGRCFESALTTRRMVEVGSTSTATSASPTAVVPRGDDRAGGSASIAGKTSYLARADDSVSRGRLSAYSSLASTDSVKDDSDSASPSRELASGSNWADNAGGGSSNRSSNNSSSSSSSSSSNNNNNNNNNNVTTTVQKKTGLAEIHRALASADSQKSINQDMQSWADELAALPQNMHRAGINMRLLGLVRNTVSTQYPEYNRILTCLLLEMIARSLKHILRSRLRRCSANSAGSERGARKHAHLSMPELTVPPRVVSSARMSAHRQVIVELLNGVLGNDPLRSEAWVDGKFGSRHCRFGELCKSKSCGFAHPRSWRFHPAPRGNSSDDAVGESGAVAIPLWLEIKQILVDKFGEEALTVEESLDGFDLRQALPNNGLIVLINRLQVMGCFSLKSDVIGQLQSLPRRRARFHAKGQQFAKLNHHAIPRVVLVDDDLLEVRARTKHMSELITRADGHSLLLAGLRKATAPHPASKLFRRACIKFQEAINGSSTPNPFTIRNELSMSLALWGRMLLEQAKVWHQSELTLDNLNKPSEPYVEWDLNFVKQAGVRFVQVLQVMCGHNVNFRNDKKKLRKLGRARRKPPYNPAWVREHGDGHSKTNNNDHNHNHRGRTSGQDRYGSSQSKVEYFEEDSLHETFSSTGFSVDAPALDNMPIGRGSPAMPASSQTLGKWDLWTRLQSCSVIECAAIAVLSNLYNNDCEVIDFTPYTFVTDRVVNVLTWYCHQSLREVWIGRRFPTQPGCTDCLTTTAVHDIISQCFLLETLAIVGIDLCEEDFVMFAPHCLKLTTLRFERVHSLTARALRDLLAKLARLQKVSFESCKGVAFQEIAAVVLSVAKRGGLPHLTKLTVRDIAGYSQQRAQQLQYQLSECGREVVVA